MYIYVCIYQIEKCNKHSNPGPIYTYIFKDYKNLTGRVLIFSLKKFYTSPGWRSSAD